uniref:SAM domain-containing protein n=1 Tax=Macrostomum lignano TaxID=282301 RepID=A0A1I8F2M6_9PLAT
MRSSSNRSSRSRPIMLGFSDSQQQPPSSRGDSVTAGSRDSFSQHQQHLRTDDKYSGPGSGNGSRTDELSRLELRLAAMESRLSDFEAMLQRSCGRSISGDCASNWPDSSATTGGELMQMGSGMGIGGNNGSAMASASVGTTEEAQISSKQSVSQCDGSPLNLVFSSENDDKETSSSSTTWTDLDSKAAEFNGKLIQSLNEACAEKPQQQKQPDKPKLIESANTESFEISRYSTQDSVVYQQRYELATQAGSLEGMDCTDKAAAVALLATGAVEQQQQHRKLMMLQASNCQLLTTTLAERAEPMPTQPSGRRRVILEAGPLRSLAEPAASAEKCGGGSGNGGCCGIECSDRSSSWQMQLVPPTVCHQQTSPSAHSATSSETATSSCPAEPIAWSRVSRVTHESASAAANRAGSSGDGNDALVVEVNRCAPPPVSIRQDRRNLGEVNNNDERGASAEQSWLLGGGQDDAFTVSTVSSTATVSMLTETSASRGRTREQQSAAAFGRRSGCSGRGFTQQNTAFIASLVSQAVSKFESDAEQASNVRLELRRLASSAPCCICGQESTACLMDIGPAESCLIFSFFSSARAIESKGSGHRRQAGICLIDRNGGFETKMREN